MQVIEKMAEDRFDRVCEAGADMLALLLRYLEDQGISANDAPAVLAVASAGALVAGGDEGYDVNAMVQRAKMMWSVDGEGNVSFRLLPRVIPADHIDDERRGGSN